MVYNRYLAVTMVALRKIYPVNICDFNVLASFYQYFLSL